MPPLPFVQITMRLRDDEVVAAFAGAGLEVLMHWTGRGFTAPDTGAVGYGYWELTPDPDRH